MEDVLEQENLRQFELPSRHDERPAARQEGFSVRNAPWSADDKPTKNGTGYAPNTASTSDFPEFGISAKKSQVAWGPSVKKFHK